MINNKIKFLFLCVILISTIALSSSSYWKFTDPKDPNDPNDAGYWTYYYVNDANDVTAIEKPIKISQWQYHILSNPKQVVEVTYTIPYASQLRTNRWFSDNSKVKIYTYQEWFQYMLKNWLNKDHIGGGFDYNDFRQFAKHSDGKLITDSVLIDPVYYFSTSKYFHAKGCKYVSSGEPLCISLKEAQIKGLKPDPTCNPYGLLTVSTEPNLLSLLSNPALDEWLESQ